MRLGGIFSSVLLVFIFSCNNKKENDIFREGIYKGIFYRHTPEQNIDTANVTLVLINNSYQGSSDSSRYPLICEGTYHSTDNTIWFQNSCGPWTTDFDWTLILDNGPFELQMEGNELWLTRNYNHGYFDRYELFLQ